MSDRPCDCGRDGGGRQTGGRGDRPDWKPEPQGTWLVIRYDSVDVGARPVPTGEVFWESLDIHVVGGDASGNPTGGQPVTLEARVWNRGDIDAVPLRVDFGFVAPALGIMPGSPHPIGTAWSSVLAGQSTVVTCPDEWTPPTYEHNLHACLIVTCSAPVQHDTPTHPANAALDRHVAQRNLSVLEAGGEETLNFRLNLANLHSARADVRLVAAAAWHAEGPKGGTALAPRLGVLAATRAAGAARDLGRARLWSDRAALLEVETRRAPRPAMPAAEVRQLARVLEVHPHKRSVPRSAGAWPAAMAEHVDFAPIGEHVALEAGQTATAELEVQVPSPRDSWLAVTFAQSIGDRLAGGYTVWIHTERS